MALDYDKLMALDIPEVEHCYSERDTILYALSLGYGTIDDEPNFVYEKNLQAVPGFGVVLAHPGFWPRDLDTGLQWQKIVHAEQELLLHRPIPPAATVRGRTRITAIEDKGADKGAIITCERLIRDSLDDSPICTVIQRMFCRGDGGFGGTPQAPVKAAASVPARPADWLDVLDVASNMALLYRWNGDLNPLHADPEIAAAAGFERPILHGLATFGLACKVLLARACEQQPERLGSLSGRFSSPVLPGQRLAVEIWHEDDSLAYQVRNLDSGRLAISNGRAMLNQ